MCLKVVFVFGNLSWGPSKRKMAGTKKGQQRHSVDDLKREIMAWINLSNFATGVS